MTTVSGLERAPNVKLTGTNTNFYLKCAPLIAKLHNLLDAVRRGSGSGHVVVDGYNQPITEPSYEHEWPGLIKVRVHEPFQGAADPNSDYFVDPAYRYDFYISLMNSKFFVRGEEKELLVGIKLEGTYIGDPSFPKRTLIKSDEVLEFIEQVRSACRPAKVVVVENNIAFIKEQELRHEPNRSFREKLAPTYNDDDNNERSAISRADLEMLEAECAEPPCLIKPHHGDLYDFLLLIRP